MESIPAEEIRAQLGKILGSNHFTASKRMQDFLTYLVEQTLEGKEQNLKVNAIAENFFNLGNNFDSRINPLVRIEAGRLRSKLDHYYLLNPDDQIEITIPKGGYKAVFKRLTPSKSMPDLTPTTPDLTESAAPGHEHYETLLVLPFLNMDKQEEIEHFTAGLSKEIILGLTRFSELKIIDKTGPVAYSSLDPAAYQSETGSKALFMLSGYTQMSGKRLRLWLTLQSVRSAYNIWSEKFEVDFEQQNGFELQEQLSEAILYRLAGEYGVIRQTLIRAYAHGELSPSLTDEAIFLYTKWTASLDLEDFAAAMDVLKKAVAAQPQNVTLQAMLADLYASDYQHCYNLVKNNLEKSFKLASKAVSIDPTCQLAHQALAFNYFLKGDKENFQHSAERALSINPASSNALATIAAWYGHMGMWDKSIFLLEKLTSLNPVTPNWCQVIYALYFCVQGDYKNALSYAQKIMPSETCWGPLLRMLPSAMLGLKEETRAAMEDLLKVAPDFQQNGIRMISRTILDKNFLAFAAKATKKAQTLLAEK